MKQFFGTEIFYKETDICYPETKTIPKRESGDVLRVSKRFLLVMHHHIPNKCLPFVLNALFFIFITHKYTKRKFIYSNHDSLDNQMRKMFLLVFFCKYPRLTQVVSPTIIMVIMNIFCFIILLLIQLLKWKGG